MERSATIYCKILPILFAAIFTSACVNEGSLEECPPDNRETPLILYVDFAENLYTRTASLSEEVESMYVFVFGHDGYYITTLVDEDGPDIGNDYLMEVPLTPGDYEFIGWSNLHGSYNLSHADLVPGETTVEELFIELDILEGDTIHDMPNHLHYGMTRTPRKADDSGWEYLMEIDKYTYTINIETEGLTPDKNDYRYVIADRNGRFSFYSDDISDRTIYYVSECDKDAQGQLSSSLRVLRLLEDHLDSKVYIEDKTTGAFLFEDNLIERLLSLREVGETVDFSTRFEYTIKLIFDAGVLVAIKVNDWTVFKTDDYEI